MISECARNQWFQPRKGQSVHESPGGAGSPLAEDDSGAQVSSLGEGDFSRDEGAAAFAFERYELSRDRISHEYNPSPDLDRSYRVGGFELTEDDVGRDELDDELR